MKASAPGKLFLAGEWAVLEPGNPGIVAAVNRRVHAELQPLTGKYISVTVEELGVRDVRLTWDGSRVRLFPLHKAAEEKLLFLRQGVEVALRFATERGLEFKPFKIKTWGEETQVAGKKVGFGSSAASTVAVIAATLGFHGYQASQEELYKLAALAHYFAQGKVGSGFDVAASVYGGVFIYTRFDPDWLVRQMETNRPLTEVVGEQWPGLSIEPLGVPQNLQFLVGWTNQSASTSAMVKQLKAWAKDHRNEYRDLFGQIATLVKDLIPAWESQDQETILRLLQENEMLLRTLGERSGVGIETPELKKLSEIAHSLGGAGKLSGAGGGDCGFAICFDKTIADAITLEWTAIGLHHLDVQIDRHGVDVKDY